MAKYVKCVRSLIDGNGFIEGNVYKIVNGKIIDEEGDKRPLSGVKVNDARDINKHYNRLFYENKNLNNAIELWFEDCEVPENQQRKWQEIFEKYKPLIDQQLQTVYDTIFKEMIVELKE